SHHLCHDKHLTALHSPLSLHDALPILEGTVRTFSPEVRKEIEELIRQTLTGVTAAYGATYDLDYKHGTMVVYNDPKLVEKSLARSEEHTSELQSPDHLVCRLRLENKKK